jgi:hypothetical protein
MKALLDYWRNHGTKVIGFVQGTLAAVCGVSGIIPDSHMKYYMAAIAILTFWRGYTNSAATPK